MALPTALLEAISAPTGGKVVLILGAGCSVDPPTSLPLSKECSLEAHRRLINDNVLQEGECQNPNDLSELADVVFKKTGSQVELVNRLPKQRFKLAPPNEGYKQAAALLREQALLAVLTLNFDLAASNALVAVGGQEVEIIEGPDDLAALSNLIYLHRNANSPPDDWVLRTEALEERWKGKWEELITQRVMAASVSVFVGLGSPAGVLTASLQKIRKSNAKSRAYVVGRGTAAQSPFLALLRLNAESYIQSTWADFMQELSARVMEEQRAKLESACAQLATTNQWPAENVVGICKRIAGLGLLGAGFLRATWFLEKDSYLPFIRVDVQLWADLILALALIERTTGLRATFSDGLLEFTSNNRRVAIIAFVSGRGTKRWLAIESELQKQGREWLKHGRLPTIAIVTSAIKPAREMSAPENLVTDYEEGDIVGAVPNIRMVDAYELRDNPELISNLVS
jgi:hypothetical protein